VVISVVDTGLGVTDEVITRRKSRGVGLSNVEQRLQRYGGGAVPLRIWSRPGTGTTAEIRIPLRAGTAIQMAASSKTT
jgi:sensor histidine kinase YesM